MGLGTDPCLGEINVSESICAYFSTDFHEGEIWETLEAFVLLSRLTYFGISSHGFSSIHTEKQIVPGPVYHCLDTQWFLEAIVLCQKLHENQKKKKEIKLFPDNKQKWQKNLRMINVTILEFYSRKV